MSSTVADLLAAALALPPEEREELATRIFDSLDPPASAIDRMTDAEFEAELTRRMDESDRDPSVRIPWEQVREMR
jgi:putative addiction module component (TIGR02574 family)